MQKVIERYKYRLSIYIILLILTGISSICDE